MKDLLNLKIEIKGEYGNMELIYEDIETKNKVIFKQYFKNQMFSYVVNRWEPKEVIYNDDRYVIIDYTKIYQIGNEITDENLINEIKEFIDDVVHTKTQLNFIGMLGLHEPKRM